MGIMVSKDVKENSELNRRISSDLRARAVNSNIYDDDDVDEETVEEDAPKKTSKFGWVWIILIILAIISLICIAFI